MSKLLLFLVILPSCCFAQSNFSLHKEQLTKLYTQAISDHIQAVYKKDNSHDDTLFFGRNPEFPDINLPSKIANTNIVVLSQEEADRKMLYKKSIVFINLIGDEIKNGAKFLFVVFSAGYRPQYNCEIDYNYIAKEKVYKLERLEFKYPYNEK